MKQFAVIGLNYFGKNVLDELLELVGATKIVFPNREAAKRITPLMLSTALLNYLPVSGKPVIAELEAPERFAGRTLIEVNLRKKYGLNLISVKNGDEEYGHFSPDCVFRDGDVALVSGTDKLPESFTVLAAKDKAAQKAPVSVT